jgi:gentisate 1,2-dioxygenase
LKDEQTIARSGDATARFYAEALEESARFREDYPTRRLNVVKAAEMPWEDSPDGRIKHLVHEKMDTVECCMEIYMQFIPPGEATGKHRHLAEEVFCVVEGEGYDLHWDVKFDCEEEFIWDWQSEPRRYEWKTGDFVYIPPYSIHQHFNSDPKSEARIIVMSNRILREMGFGWFEQLENAKSFKG